MARNRLLSALPDLNEPIRLLITDVDGVLTDGSIIYDANGGEIKRFCVYDGTAAKMWLASGRTLGVITARRSEVVEKRMAELGVWLVHQGAEHKGAALEIMLARAEMESSQAAYIGDDLADLPAMKRVALPIAVRNAVAEVKKAARWTTDTPGGKGALREVVEVLLKHDREWDDIVERIH